MYHYWYIYLSVKPELGGPRHFIESRFVTPPFFFEGCWRARLYTSLHLLIHIFVSEAWTGWSQAFYCRQTLYTIPPFSRVLEVKIIQKLTFIDAIFVSQGWTLWSQAFYWRQTFYPPPPLWRVLEVKIIHKLTFINTYICQWSLNLVVPGNLLYPDFLHPPPFFKGTCLMEWILTGHRHIDMFLNWHDPETAKSIPHQRY